MTVDRKRAARDSATESAWAAAEFAAGRSGVRLAPLTTLEDAARINDVIWQVWGEQQLGQELIRAFQHAGSVLIGAFDGDRLIGFCLGFAGLGEGLHLHSHMAAVVPERQVGGVGYALKLAQRAACLDLGVEEIRWTYDPLVARNARFNLVKLGAVGARFLPEFYGEMKDLLNRGDRSDRFEVVWRLRSPRVERAIAERPSPAEPPADAPVLLRLAGSPDAPAPVPTGAKPAGRALVAIPGDLHALRARDPELAAAWRTAAAEAFRRCFDGGLVATSITADGSYLFEPAKEALA